MKKNKLNFLLIALCTLLITPGCGTATSQPVASPTKATTNKAQKSEPNKANSGKILIAYFSYSTGHNTKLVAEQIQKATGGKLVEIKTKVPYSSNYNQVVSQGKDEVANHFKPELTTEITDWNAYDTVIVGSPIWWYHISPALASFLAKQNWQGKKVALFTTHGGFGPGESDKDLQEYCNKATILKSYSAPGEKVKSSEQAVVKWLNEIGITK